jgi:hypothetical protein
LESLHLDETSFSPQSMTAGYSRFPDLSSPPGRWQSLAAVPIVTAGVNGLQTDGGDPRKTKEIVWQYGVTDHPGHAPGYLNYPDGLDADVFRDWRAAVKAR